MCSRAPYAFDMRLNFIARVLVLSTTSFLAACSQLVFGLANVPTYFGSAERTGDIAYGEDDRQSLDVYRPKAVRSAPVVVFWYGGSWTSGTKESYRFVGSALASRGFVAVLPDYRLHPDVRFPAFIDDAAHAVAWVQANIEKFGGDPTRIVLMGHSAGAHIATFVGIHPEYLQRAGVNTEHIKGLVGLSGPYALDPNSAMLNRIFSSPYSHADWQPVRFVSPQTPPTLLIHGNEDRVVAPSHTDAMHRALTEADVPTEIALYDGRNHADTVAAFAWPARGRIPVLDRSAEFIRKVTTPDRT